jgi:ABC-type transport system substrate-binding protein
MLLQSQWQKIGVKVDVKIFELNDLNQNIIRPRKYDALLFGEVVSTNADL